MISKILREIKIDESRVSKSAMLTHWGSEFRILSILALLKTKIYQINSNLKPLKWQKKSAVLALLDSANSV